MTARKPVHVEPTDWVKIIQAISTGIVMVMVAYFGVKQKQMGESVEKVRAQTDGSVTASKLAIAISAESLAESTKKPEHKKIADEARAAYETQLQIQKRSEN